MEGAQAGVFEEEERDLVQRALKLDDRPVRELMTPLAQRGVAGRPRPARGDPEADTRGRALILPSRP
jgi:hypothetical protein